jgi:hypothetical protein
MLNSRTRIGEYATGFGQSIARLQQVRALGYQLLLKVLVDSNSPVPAVEIS